MERQFGIAINMQSTNMTIQQFSEVSSLEKWSHIHTTGLKEGIYRSKKQHY